MAIQFTGNTGNWLRRATTLVDGAPYTIGLWARPTLNGVQQVLFKLEAANAAQSITVQFSSGGALQLVQNGTVKATIASGQITLNGWRYYSLTLSATGTAATLRSGPSGATTFSGVNPAGGTGAGTVTAISTNPALIIGRDPAQAVGFTGQIEGVKIYEVALTAAQSISEMSQGDSGTSVSLYLNLRTADPYGFGGATEQAGSGGVPLSTVSLSSPTSWSYDALNASASSPGVAASGAGAVADSTYVQSPAQQVGMSDSRSSISRAFSFGATGSFEIDYWVSSEAGFDFFFYRIDGGDLLPAGAAASGLGTTGIITTGAAASGSHTLTLGYQKDGGVDAGEDRARVLAIRRYEGSTLAETHTFSGSSPGQPPAGWTVNTDDARLSTTYPWTYVGPSASVSGTFAATTDGSSATGSGTLAVSGAFVSGTDDATATGSGYVAGAGTFAGTTDATAVGAGTVANSGAFVQAADDATAQGAGTVLAPGAFAGLTDATLFAEGSAGSSHFDGTTDDSAATGLGSPVLVGTFAGSTLATLTGAAELGDAPDGEFLAETDAGAFARGSPVVSLFADVTTDDAGSTGLGAPALGGDFAAETDATMLATERPLFVRPRTLLSLLISDGSRGVALVSDGGRGMAVVPTQPLSFEVLT